MLKQLRLALLALVLSPFGPVAVAQIQFNTGGGINYGAGRPQAGIPVPARPPEPPNPFDMTPSADEVRLHQEFRELGNKEGLTPASIPKLIEVAKRQYEATKSAHGEGHPHTLAVAKTLARLHHYDMYHGAEGEATWALAAYRSVKLIKEKFAGETDSLFAGALGGVIMPLCNLGRLDEAAPCVKEAIPLYEESKINAYLAPLGRPQIDSLHYLIQNGLLGIGEYFRRTGDLASAEPWFKRAMAFAKDPLANQEEYMIAERCLATVYEDIRDYKRAEPLRMDAYRIATAGFGSDQHPGTVVDLECLAWNYNKQGRLADAESLLRKALALRQKSPQRDIRGESRAANGLADVLYRSGKGREAAELYKLALAGYEQKGGLDEIATARFNEGLYFSSQGKLKEAAQDFRTAIGLFEKAANPANDDFEDRALRNLAAAEWFLGEKEKAREHAQDWVRRFDVRLARVLSFADEGQRLGWMQWQCPYDLTAALGMPEETATMLLRTKGIILDSVLEDRALAQQDVAGSARASWEELLRVRDNLRQAWAAGRSADKGAILKLEARESELQGALARAGLKAGHTRGSLKSTLADLQHALPEDAAFLDYFRFAHRSEPTAKSVERYGVVLHRPGQKPKLAILGTSARELDGMIHLFLLAMHKPPAVPRDKDEALTTLLKYFHSALIGPLEKDLAGLRTLVISGDSEINFLPFACVMDPSGRFLCERHSLRQINSARDLLAENASAHAPGNKTLALFGGASYRLGHEGAGTADGKAGAQAYIEEMIKGNHTLIPPLPGAKREVELLAVKAEAAGWKADLRSGDTATEPALRKLGPPAVLHLATHGYFMPRPFNEQTENALSLISLDGRSERLRTLFDPMQRSGVFLAGAEDTFEQWRQGKICSVSEDGVLTAAEASGLDLRGTWLVTLSACDTGVGDTVNGEGVLGLRRAFHYAGARNVMMSLWPIQDAETAAFVDDFYARALASQDAATALNETERDWLRRMHKARDLWWAIKCGGAFILVGMGR